MYAETYRGNLSEEEHILLGFVAMMSLYKLCCIIMMYNCDSIPLHWEVVDRPFCLSSFCGSLHVGQLQDGHSFCPSCWYHTVKPPNDFTATANITCSHNVPFANIYMLMHFESAQYVKTFLFFFIC